MAKEITFEKKTTKIYQLLKQTLPFSEFSDSELKLIVPFLKRFSYSANEIVIKEGEIGNAAYIAESGDFCFEKKDRPLKIFSTGTFFGEIAAIDKSPRLGTIRALTDATVYELMHEHIFDESGLSDALLKKLYRGFARQLSSYLRDDNAFYKRMDVLLIQDGGCAPGYNSITSFITEHLEKSGRKIFIAAQGFRSLVGNQDEDYRCLIYNKSHFEHFQRIPGVIYSPPLRNDRGADFRSERFKDFIDPKNQRIAVQSIIQRNVQVVVAIGGNGTFAGINALRKYLPENIRLFFIPVTIDSDIYGTNCIGEYTGVEIGAEKIRCYMADARTHNRCYIIEMMGALGGYHALHSCLGAGAHLAVLPSSNYDIMKVAHSLKVRDYAVIVVAEGYKKKQRDETNFNGNAADFFKQELEATGIGFKTRIITEPFSRDIRGASPNNLDITLAQRLSRKLQQLIESGQSNLMPAVLANREYSIPFDEICTDNSVESELAGLANRLF